MAGCFTFPNACKSRRMRLTILIAQEKVFPAVAPADHRADDTGILDSRDPRHTVTLAPLAHGLKKNMRGASPSCRCLCEAERGTLARFHHADGQHAVVLTRTAFGFNLLSGPEFPRYRRQPEGAPQPERLTHLPVAEKHQRRLQNPEAGSRK